MIEEKKLEREVEANIIIDAKQLNSPIPLLRMKKKLATMSSGDILQVDCTDPGSCKDIDSWCSRMDHKYLGQKNENLFFSLYIVKG